MRHHDDARRRESWNSMTKSFAAPPVRLPAATVVTLG
jgi:hypothetical protein